MNTPALTFLERDFTQCFEQMRYYDSQLWDIAKFSFAGYTVVLGAAAGVYQYSRESLVNLVPVAVVAVIVSFVLGLVFLAIAVRNRVYFVVVARYINEHRRFFLHDRPGGFANVTGMYTDPTQPPYFDIMSSQSAMLYAIATLNAALPAAIPLFTSAEHALTYSMIFFLVLLLGQLWISIRYLLSRGEGSPSENIFGRRRAPHELG
jgi:hypothetical protein